MLLVLQCIGVYIFTCVKFVLPFVILCDLLSESPHCSHNFRFLEKILSSIHSVKDWIFKFQLNQVCNCEIIALESSASKKIDLYSNHIENKLQELTFATITFVCVLGFGLKCSPVIGQSSKL